MYCIILFNTVNKGNMDFIVFIQDFNQNNFLQDLQEHVSAYLEGQKKDSRESSLEKHVKVS